MLYHTAYFISWFLCVPLYSLHLEAEALVYGFSLPADAGFEFQFCGALEGKNTWVGIN